MLRVIDTRWVTYLQKMDYLKTGIGLRGFGQRGPPVKYKTEAFAAFQMLIAAIYEDFLKTILRLQITIQAAQEKTQETENSELQGASYSGPREVNGDNSRPKGASRGEAMLNQALGSGSRTYRKDENDPWANVGRNDPCPCGSGKKYKNCHMRKRQAA